MVKALKILGIGSGILIFLVVAWFVALLNNGPDTSVYLGAQVPKHFMNDVRKLGLLEEGETIKFFYSDGIFDIKDGFYFVSDKHLVIYSDVWEEPASVFTFDEIISLDVEYNDSFLDDSMVYFETETYAMSFPVSSEYGRDKQFVEYLEEQIATHRPPASPESAVSAGPSESGSEDE